MEILLESVGVETLRRYASAWEAGWQVGQTLSFWPTVFAPADLERIPLFQFTDLLKKVVALKSESMARNLYSALCLFPCLSQLRFEPTLKAVKRNWGAAVPRYHTFYRVQPLINALAKSVIWDSELTEKALRLRAILALRFFCLFRGIDLARAKRDLVITNPEVWYLKTRRKGRRKEGLYPVARISLASVCPQSCLSVYLEKSKDYSGDALFVSLTFPRRPISADTINSLTTEWLHARGLMDFTAHSTRASSATEMVAAGVNPRLVAVLGDWLSHDCFQRFYLRVQA